VPSQLDDDPHDARVGEVGDVALETHRVVGERDACRQDELATVEELGDVGHLADMEPADLAPEPARPGEDSRRASDDLGQSKHLGNGDHDIGLTL
jgi:hypothetical protein